MPWAFLSGALRTESHDLSPGPPHLPPAIPTSTRPHPGVNLVPEGPDGDEAFHSFSKVGEQGELGGVIQLLQVPVPGEQSGMVRRAGSGLSLGLHLSSIPLTMWASGFASLELSLSPVNDTTPSSSCEDWTARVSKVLNQLAGTVTAILGITYPSSVPLSLCCCCCCCCIASPCREAAQARLVPLHR